MLSHVAASSGPSVVTRVPCLIVWVYHRDAVYKEWKTKCRPANNTQTEWPSSISVWQLLIPNVMLQFIRKLALMPVKARSSIASFCHCAPRVSQSWEEIASCICLRISPLPQKKGTMSFRRTTQFIDAYSKWLFCHIRFLLSGEAQSQFSLLLNHFLCAMYSLLGLNRARSLPFDRGFSVTKTRNTPICSIQ